LRKTSLALEFHEEPISGIHLVRMRLILHHATKLDEWRALAHKRLRVKYASGSE
jgi:hypothetical protein